MPFYVWDLSILGFWYLMGGVVLEKSPMDTERQLYLNMRELGITPDNISEFCVILYTLCYCLACNVYLPVFSLLVVVLNFASKYWPVSAALGMLQGTCKVKIGESYVLIWGLEIQESSASRLGGRKARVSFATTDPCCCGVLNLTAHQLFFYSDFCGCPYDCALYCVLKIQ